jgi:hypothetical protein
MSSVIPPLPLVDRTVLSRGIDAVAVFLLVLELALILVAVLVVVDAVA